MYVRTWSRNREDPSATWATTLKRSFHRVQRSHNCRGRDKGSNNILSLPLSSWLMMLEVTSLLYAIGSLICVVHCQTDREDDFILELKELLPCSETEPGTNVSLHKSDIPAVQTNLTLCSDSSWSINQFNVSRDYSTYRCMHFSSWSYPDFASCTVDTCAGLQDTC